MSDDPVYKYFFVHNTLAHFYKNFLDYISMTVYPRFETKLISTYDKAVQYLSDKDRLGGREQDKPNLPALILNPNGEITTEDAGSGGRQLWRFSKLAPGLNKGLFTPIYQDQNVQITPVFGRLKGEIELIMLLNSFYEYCDLRVLFIQYFNGMNRKIKMDGFNSFIIIPKELHDYRYTNDVTGEDYILDWEKYGVEKQLIKTIDKTEWVYPCLISTLADLTSIGDGSTKYGGIDKLADWRMTATFEFEIEIPWYMVMQSNFMANNIDLQIDFGSVYSLNDYKPPENREIEKFHYEFDTTSTDTIIYPSDSTDVTITEKLSIEINTRYYLIVTKQQAIETEEFTTNLPEIVTNQELLIVNSKHGKLKFGTDYAISFDGTQITIITNSLTYNEGDIIELYVYKPV